MNNNNNNTINTNKQEENNINIDITEYEKLPSMNIIKLQEIVNKANSVDLNNIKNKFNSFKVKSGDKIQEKLTHLNNKITDKLNKIKQSIKEKLINIQNKYNQVESRVEFNQADIPENFTLEETQKLFEKALKNTSKQACFNELENIVNLVKKYSDTEKTQSSFNDMEHILYTKSFGERTSSLTTSIPTKFTHIKKCITSIENTTTNLIKDRKTSIIYNYTIQKFTSNPTDLVYLSDITDKCQKAYTIDSVFTSFVTFDNKTYVVWANPKFIIEVFDFSSNTIVNTLTGHTQHVYIVRNFKDKRVNTDYLLSTSYDKTVRVWNVQENFKCILHLKTGHTGYYLYSGLMIFDESIPTDINHNDSNDNTNNKSGLYESSYILTSVPNEMFKLFNLNGKLIRELGTKKDYTYFLDKYYDNRTEKLNIINANSSDVKVYDYLSGDCIKTFKDEDNTWHMSAYVNQINNNTYLFETDGNGYLRIWNYDDVSIYKKMSTGCNLRGLVSWNSTYVIAASSDKSVKVFDIENKKIVNSITNHDNVLCCVQKVEHPVYGESLLSSAIDGKIKLYVNKDKIKN